MMRYVLCALTLAIALLSCAPPARADDASRISKAEELLQIIQGDQIMKSIEPMMKSMAAGLGKPDMPAEERAKLGEMQQRIMALTFDRINKARPAFARIYADTYTEEEIDGLLAFYKSPVGKSFLQKMPSVTQRSTTVMLGLMGDLQSEVKKITDEMKQKPK